VTALAAAAPWWLWGLAAMGVIAVLAVIVTLFVALGSRPQEVSAPDLPPPGSDAFLAAASGVVNAPIRTGGTIRLLHNGDGFLPALLDDLAGAQRSITFSVYIWEEGEMSRQIWEALAERARAGVAVRLLLDGLGGFDADDDRIEALRAAGGWVDRFRPPRFGKLTRLHRRNHRRAIVIDGVIGYTGGAAVGDEWLGDARHPGEWREMMVRGTGPFARSIQAAFAGSWAAVTGEILAGDALYPPAPTDTPKVGGTHHLSVVSSPADEAHPLRKFFWISFAAARERIWLTASYFAPDEHLRVALEERAQAGVDVRLILPNEHTDARPVRWAGQGYYEELLEGGVRIFEYQPTFMHAKALVVDSVWSVVGTANLDIRSKELNEENVLGVLDRGLAAELEAAFEADLQASREIRLDAWRERPLHWRLRERTSLLFAEQM
jgi:cardiolipin synthase A/B